MACEVVVEQLGKTRHKRSHCMHVVIVQRLMTGRWRRLLMREADLYFHIPIESPSLCEPLLMFVCLPFVPHRTWIADHECLLDKVVNDLLKEGVWPTDH